MKFEGKSTDYIKGYHAARKDMITKDLKRIEKEMDESDKRFEEAFKKLRQMM